MYKFCSFRWKVLTKHFLLTSDYKQVWSNWEESSLVMLEMCLNLIQALHFPLIWDYHATLCVILFSYRI